MAHAHGHHESPLVTTNNAPNIPVGRLPGLGVHLRSNFAGTSAVTLMTSRTSHSASTSTANVGHAPLQITANFRYKSGPRSIHFAHQFELTLWCNFACNFACKSALNLTLNLRPLFGATRGATSGPTCVHRQVHVRVHLQVYVPGQVRGHVCVRVWVQVRVEFRCTF